MGNNEGDFFGETIYLFEEDLNVLQKSIEHIKSEEEDLGNIEKILIFLTNKIKDAESKLKKLQSDINIFSTQKQKGEQISEDVLNMLINDYLIYHSVVWECLHNVSEGFSNQIKNLDIANEELKKLYQLISTKSNEFLIKENQLSTNLFGVDSSITIGLKKNVLIEMLKR